VLGRALCISAEDVMLKNNIVDPRPLIDRVIAEAAAIKAEEERKAAEKAAKAAAREAAAASDEAAPAKTAKAAVTAGATESADEEVAP